MDLRGCLTEHMRGCLVVWVVRDGVGVQGERMEVVIGTNQTDTADGVYVVSEVVDEAYQPGENFPPTSCGLPSLSFFYKVIFTFITFIFSSIFIVQSN